MTILSLPKFSLLNSEISKDDKYYIYVVFNVSKIMAGTLVVNSTLQFGNLTP